MAEKFSTLLRRRGERIWRAIESHPFLRELHAGTLPMDRFTYFILQDYVYLLDFAQVLCQGAAKSPDLETLELFARHALGAVEVERSFHASFGKTLGLSRRTTRRGAEGADHSGLYRSPTGGRAKPQSQRDRRRGSSLLLDLWRSRKASTQKPAEQAENLPGMDRDLRFRRILEAGTRANRVDEQTRRSGKDGREEAHDRSFHSQQPI